MAGSAWLAGCSGVAWPALEARESGARRLRPVPLRARRKTVAASPAQGAATTSPAPTVLLEASSIKMKLPVRRLLS